MSLDPRRLPRSYAETLQDLLDMHERLSLLDGTAARHMRYALMPAIDLARAQLKQIEQAAVRRVLKT